MPITATEFPAASSPAAEPLGEVQAPRHQAVRFATVAVGATFFARGDTMLNYDYPKWCECTKLDDWTGQEIERNAPDQAPRTGIRFGVSPEDDVWVLP